MYNFDGKSHKFELKAAENIKLITLLRIMPLVTYALTGLLIRNFKKSSKHVIAQIY